jgi:hypothetical protein
MAAIKNDRDLALQAVSPRLIATSVAISADAAEFLQTKNGGPVSPTTITLTAVPTIFTSPTYAWYYALGTSPTTWVSLGSGGTQVLTGSTIAGLIGSAKSITYKVDATQSGFNSASNTFVLTYAEEASEPVEVLISRTATAVPSDTAGVVTVFDNTGTVITVKRGTSNLNYNATSGANTFYVSSVTINPGAGVTLGTLTGAGTTATYADITAMSTSFDTVTVTYTVTVRDASGNVISPSTNVQQTFTKVASGTGEDAYHIRLDNEARIVNYEYNNTPKNGSLPVIAQAYVTSGPTDITVAGGYVTYSINSVSGATGASIDSSGEITVTGIDDDVNYVEIKAVIDEPTRPAMDAYKKLFIYKVKDGALAGDLQVTADHEYYEYTTDATTTTISAWDPITITATFTGLAGTPEVTWSAKAYDVSGNELSPGGAALFTASGNTATMSPTQFGARGNPTTRRVVVTATYNTGLGVLSDSVRIYRYDPSGGYIIYIHKDSKQNFNWSFTENESNIVTQQQLNEEASNLSVIRLSDLGLVTAGWSFTASSPDAGVTIDITGVAGGPYVATSDTDTIIKLTHLPTTYVNDGTVAYKINITATKATFPTIYETITYTIRSPASDGLVISADPVQINLPIGADGLVTSYLDTYTHIKIFRNSVDVTQTETGWTITKVDGPGVTSVIEAP